ncbi:unnamed protein product [Pleuronectes platessa]|uniref:Uncharacterized protein n=1 Tax=Pleuronectes platessa TaxID=8262 RepID=A0A9N7Z548_PLEPL|nr:unnamed protein product [Pleuronectes platessa]
MFKGTIFWMNVVWFHSHEVSELQGPPANRRTILILLKNLNKDLPISIECVDNAAGCPGVVIYDDETFPISSDQDATHETASGDGQGPGSSVTVFQLDCYAGEDYIVTLEDPPEIVTDSDASLEDEVDEDE